MPVWTPDLAVDEPLVRELLAQFPELDGAPVRRLATGWDNSVWVVSERYAFRIPHREVAIPGVERELAVLPELAPRLPLPVPRPVFVGTPGEGYPWPFFGAELLPGEEAGSAELDDEQRLEVALDLARFLRVLHAVELDARLPRDPNGREDMAKRTHLAREELWQLKRLGVWRAPAEAEELLLAAEELPPPERRVVAHGDLHFRHLLVDGGRASGVIDWGDVCLADPAIDLSLLWSFVAPRQRVPFLEAYGPVTDAQLVRSRVLALQLCATLAHYGRVEENAAVERAGVDGLERTLAA
ncbi:MAG TPA: phosphotransferase [Gaiellaceae bacterium]|nr:phosphotransferase [Gaiellaceae bacterium]